MGPLLADIVCWLMTGTSRERYIDVILAQLGGRLQHAGIPLARATLHFRTHHPQWLGSRLTWRRGMASAEVVSVGYEVASSPRYANSPFRAIADGATEIRARIDRGCPANINASLYDELKAALGHGVAA